MGNNAMRAGTGSCSSYTPVTPSVAQLHIVAQWHSCASSGRTTAHLSHPLVALLSGAWIVSLQVELPDRAFASFVVGHGMESYCRQRRSNRHGRSIARTEVTPLLTLLFIIYISSAVPARARLLDNALPLPQLFDLGVQELKDVGSPLPVCMHPSR
jgi:hypothetical protein